MTRITLRPPPHLYSVTTLPSKTHTTADINGIRYMFDLLMLMAHKQSYVVVMLNKRRYTSDIAVFDNVHGHSCQHIRLFSRPLHHSLKLFLSMRRCDIFSTR